VVLVSPTVLSTVWNSSCSSPSCSYIPCVFQTVYLIVNRIFNFSYFDTDYPTSELAITELERVYCTVFWYIKTRSMVVYWCFIRMYYFYVQGRKASQVSTKYAASLIVKMENSSSDTSVHFWVHEVTTQKTVGLISQLMRFISYREHRESFPLNK
jgi:hypothetical protein